MWIFLLLFTRSENIFPRFLWSFQVAAKRERDIYYEANTNALIFQILTSADQGDDLLE